MGWTGRVGSFTPGTPYGAWVAISPKPGRGVIRPPAVRLAPRDELAAAARVAPLMRAARDLAKWAAVRPGLSAADAESAARDLGLSPEEIEAAWQVATGARMVGGEDSGQRADVLSADDPDAVLNLWDDALSATLCTGELEGLVTALYTAGEPVRIDALFEAYQAARQQVPPATSGQGRGGRGGTGRAEAGQTETGQIGQLEIGQAGTGPDGTIQGGMAQGATGPGATDQSGTGQGETSRRAADQGGPDDDGPGDDGTDQGGTDRRAAGERATGQGGSSQGASEQRGPGQDGDVVELSAALETLADLGVVDLDTDDEAGGLTVGLSRLGTWGVHGRLRARGWQLPVAGQLAQDRAAVLLAALADYDAEQGEAEIAAWLALRGPGEAAAELIEAASQGSPGLRGAAFAVLDRVGEDAVPAVGDALADPVIRPHAVVWLRDHGEQAQFAVGDQEWLLVDLGAGLLEEAEPEDVVAELLPDLPSGGQAKLVAGLWEVSHPGLIGLLTALGEHHHDPAVAKAARKAALKARSRAATEPDDE